MKAPLSPEQVAATARWLATWERVVHNEPEEPGDPPRDAAELRSFAVIQRDDGVAVASAFYVEDGKHSVVTNAYRRDGSLIEEFSRERVG